MFKSMDFAMEDRNDFKLKAVTQLNSAEEQTRIRWVENQGLLPRESILQFYNQTNKELKAVLKIKLSA